MLLSELYKKQDRIENIIETVLHGIEKHEDVRFAEPLHDIAHWVAMEIEEFRDESKEHTN